MSIPLSYVPLNSSVNPSFWSKLSELKIDVYKSNEIDVVIWGYSRLIENANLPTSLLEVDSTSFNKEFSDQETYIPFYGKFINTNTIEKFKSCDKQLLINNEGMKFVERLKNGDVLKNPSLLNWFILLTFADIKKYHYYYWFAFPVPQSVTIEKVSSCNISEEFSDEMMIDFYNEFKKLNSIQTSYFVTLKINNLVYLSSLYETFSDESVLKDREPYFTFLNLSPSSNVGSQLRTFVAFILHHRPILEGTKAKFLALNLSRDKTNISLKKSTIYTLKLPEVSSIDMSTTWVGWEKNERDNMGPRLANMKNTLDPAVMAEISNDLNLKLMKWNLLPNIDLQKIKATKCLLLGAGTLGCSVARTLLGWGIRNITFVDNAVVSSSNPVRQSLFTFQDALKSKPKAQAAADSLKLICPGVNSNGYQFTIPMPGHPVGESLLMQTMKEIDKLTELIQNNDIIFLLLDSREGRWLPTLIAASKQKMVINAALGFDSYLVMRHGVYEPKIQEPKAMTCPAGFKSVDGRKLGCYFCTDIVAPGNSMKDRPLDQQCTVTRPGVSQIAGALAAELSLSLLMHEEQIAAPAFYVSKQNVNDLEIDKLNPSILGLVPHSIRGFISSYEQFSPATEKFTNCVACSDFVVRQYRDFGKKFLFEVFNNSKHLEEVAKVPKFDDLSESDIYETGVDEEFSDWAIQ